MTDRSNKDCRKRWQKIDAKWNSGAWTSNEDENLRQAVVRHGTRYKHSWGIACVNRFLTLGFYSWAATSTFVGTRSPDRTCDISFNGVNSDNFCSECAKRWRNALDPSISHNEWKADEVCVMLRTNGFADVVNEDSRLLQAVQSLGRDWKSICERFFPDRSRLDLSNRYQDLSLNIPRIVAQLERAVCSQRPRHALLLRKGKNRSTARPHDLLDFPLQQLHSVDTKNTNPLGDRNSYAVAEPSIDFNDFNETTDHWPSSTEAMEALSTEVWSHVSRSDEELTL